MAFAAPPFAVIDSLMLRLNSTAMVQRSLGMPRLTEGLHVFHSATRQHEGSQVY